MDFYSFMIETIKAAGELLLLSRSKGFDTTTKNGDSRDSLTSVDKVLENFIIQKIKKKFTEHSIYSEEGAGFETGGEYKWTIDPIDGTANFSRGIPHYAVCLGLLKNNQAIVGAVYNPVTRELFSFERGRGSFLNEVPIEVSSIEELKDAHVFFHAGRKDKDREWGGESYKQLLKNAKKTSNLASSSLDTCFVAAGRIEANIYGTLSVLDIAPAIGILKEAGGVIANSDGNYPKLNATPQRIYMACNKKILDSLRNLL